MENESWISGEMGSGGRGVKMFDRHEGDETGKARGAGVGGKATGVNGR